MIIQMLITLRKNKKPHWPLLLTSPILQSPLSTVFIIIVTKRRTTTMSDIPPPLPPPNHNQPPAEDDEETKRRKRQERLEQNRISARESRKRKKTMIEELQKTVITLSRENKELNERNEGLRRQLIDFGAKVSDLVSLLVC